MNDPTSEKLHELYIFTNVMDDKLDNFKKRRQKFFLVKEASSPVMIKRMIKMVVKFRKDTFYKKIRKREKCPSPSRNGEEADKKMNDKKK